MKVSVFDMDLLKDSWSTSSMRDIFNEESRIQKMLDVEAALARAQGELGIIPKEAAKEITLKAKYNLMNLDYILNESKKTKHPLVPIVRGLELACKDKLGEFVHFGVTTQDIIDTALVLQIKDGMTIIKRELKDIAIILRALASEHKNTPMMGRTLSLQALPITFGHKVSIWLSQIVRHFDRIVELESRLYVGCIVGAVGTKASLGDKHNEVERLTLKDLGLFVPEISWQPARDNFIELGYVLGNINATFNKIAHQILILSHNEINELNEPFGLGQVGSSTMPHKKNPAISENAVTVSNTLKSNIAILGDIERHEHERDGQVWKMEWKIIPEIFLMLSVVLDNIKIALDGLEVRKQDMLKNLNTLGGFVLSERVMFALSPHYGKQQAHEIVYEAAIRGMNDGASFKDTLMTDDKVRAALNEEEITHLLDPTTYIGYAPSLVDEFLHKIEGAQIWKD